MSPADALRALVFVHAHALRRLPHPTQPELTALDYARHHMSRPNKPDTTRKAVNVLRRALDLEVARGRPVSRTVHVRVAVCMWRLVGDVAAVAGVSVPAAVRMLVGELEPVKGADDDEPKPRTLRVPLDVVEHHGNPAGVRRALLSLMTPRSVDS